MKEKPINNIIKNNSSNNIDEKKANTINEMLKKFIEKMVCLEKE